jgi:hypothetical protein
LLRSRVKRLYSKESYGGIKVLFACFFFQEKAGASFAGPTIARKSPEEPPTGRWFFVNQRVTLLEISIPEPLSSRKRGNFGAEKDRAA